MLQGEILHYVQTPQLLAHILNSQALDALKETNIKHVGRQRGRKEEGKKEALAVRTAHSLDGSHTLIVNSCRHAC